MSTHPNAILLCVLAPDGLTRATYRNILEEHGKDSDDPAITIEADEYHVRVVEDGYDTDYQIGAKQGDIIVFDMVTYGYGERIEWDKLAAQKAALEAWAVGVCERNHCKAQFYVTANYW